MLENSKLFYLHRDMNIRYLFCTVNIELHRINSWLYANKHFLNVTKTKYSLFHKFFKKNEITLSPPKLEVKENIQSKCLLNCSEL